MCIDEMTALDLSPSACVARGMALLDRFNPPWWRYDQPETVRINVHRLDMVWSDQCVIGQSSLYGYHTTLCSMSAWLTQQTGPGIIVSPELAAIVAVMEAYAVTTEGQQTGHTGRLARVCGFEGQCEGDPAEWGALTDEWRNEIITRRLLDAAQT